MTSDIEDRHRRMLETVLQRLADLDVEVFLVGGVLTMFLIDDIGAAPPRPTDDIDLVVTHVERVDAASANA